MTVWQSSLYRLVKAKIVSETIQEEHVERIKKWARDETLENISVKWREKPAKENQECLALWKPKRWSLKKESNNRMRRKGPL